MLAEGPKSGYELMKRVREAFDRAPDAPSLSPGTLYPLLHRMEAAGLLASEEEPRGMRRRKVYRLTDKGLRHLLEMLSKGVDLMCEGFRLHIAALRNAARDIAGKRELREAAAEILGKLDEAEKLLREMKSILREAATPKKPGE